MGTKKFNKSLSTTWIVLFILLVLFSERTNMTHGAYADFWILPIIMLVFALIGAVIGGAIGSIIGLIASIFKFGGLKPGLKIGAFIGSLAVLAFWYLGCLVNGTAVCIAQ